MLLVTFLVLALVSIVHGALENQFLDLAFRSAGPTNTHTDDLAIDHLRELLASRSDYHRQLRRRRRGRRELWHTIPPYYTPRGCEYFSSQSDSNKTYVDQITCPNACGVGLNVTLTATAFCGSGGSGCINFADCRVTGCTNECGPEAGGCPCAGMLRGIDALCAAVCTTEVLLAAPTLEPSSQWTVSSNEVSSDVPSDSPSKFMAEILSDVPSLSPTQLSTRRKGS